MNWLWVVVAVFPAITNGFTAVWLGAKFRNETFANKEMNDHLLEICGHQKESDVNEYPWAVSFVVDDVNRLGGSIISPYHIITAAHGFMNTLGVGSKLCLSVSNSTVYKPIDVIRKTRLPGYGGKCIRGYSFTLPNHPRCHEADVQFNRIKSVLIDGDFSNNACQKGNDWAIVELENKIEFTDDIKPICLPAPNRKIDGVLNVAGWGRSYIFNESGPMIHEIPMKIDLNCSRPWSDTLPNKADDLICATSLDPKNYFAPRTCHGDSGSGMETRDAFGRATLLAMTSFGTRGCPANMLARFTRIDTHLFEICKYTGVCYSLRKKKELDWKQVDSDTSS